MNKRSKGSEWELKAGEFLSRHGIQVLEYNFRCKIGEIDIVGTDGKFLIFFEVKYRSSNKYGYAVEAVNKKKQSVILKVSDYYRITHNISPIQSVRYDVVAIENNIIKWIPGAFGYSG